MKKSWLKENTRHLHSHSCLIMGVHRAKEKHCSMDAFEFKEK